MPVWTYPALHHRPAMSNSTDTTDTSGNGADQTQQNTNFATILGPVILGQCAGILFLGILLAVASRCISSPAWSRATWRLRAAMVFVVAGSCVASGLGINDLWYYAVINSNDINVVLAGTSAQCMEPIVTGLVAITVQIVLVTRAAKVITKRWMRWVFITVLTATAILSLWGAAAMTAWSMAYHLHPLDSSGDLTSKLGMSWTTLFRIWLWSATAVDVTITIVYIIALKKKLNAATDGGTETSQSVLKLIVIGAVRCAAYTSILAATSAIITQKFGLESINTYLICYAFWEPLAPLYALSLFTTLSVADTIVERLSDPNIRRTNGSKIGQNYNSGGLPAFYVSEAGTSVGGGGGIGGLGGLGGLGDGLGGRGGSRLSLRPGSTAGSVREGSLFGGDDVGGGGGGGAPFARTTSEGVLVQVERKEEVDEGEKDRAFGMV